MTEAAFNMKKANCEVREKTNKMQQLDVYYRLWGATNHIQQNQCSAPHAITYVLVS